MLRPDDDRPEHGVRAAVAADPDRLLVGDPAYGNRTMTVEDFRRAWTSGVGFVIRRNNEPKPPNRLNAPADLFLVPSGSTLRAADSALRQEGTP